MSAEPAVHGNPYRVGIADLCSGPHLPPWCTHSFGFSTEAAQADPTLPKFGKGLRTLAEEDDLGIELIHLLDEHQQKVAIVDPTAAKS